jgi:hypothetical protein
MHFGGARLVALYPLGPIFEGMALNITAISSGDGLGVGLVGCRDWLPDLWEVSDGIRSGLDELLDRLPGESSEAVDVEARSAEAESGEVAFDGPGAARVESGEAASDADDASDAESVVADTVDDRVADTADDRVADRVADTADEEQERAAPAFAG